MKKRSPAKVVILTLLTFSLYAYYWLYTTTQELREQTGRKDLSPALDVLLTLFTAGLWGIYAGYRNASIVHEELKARNVSHQSKALLVAGAVGASYFTGAAWLVAMALLQEEYNRLAEKPDYFASVRPYEAVDQGAYFDEPFEAPPPRARVAPARARVAPAAPAAPVFVEEAASEPASPASHGSQGSHAGQGSQGTPSAPVFLSDAPAPIVY